MKSVPSIDALPDLLAFDDGHRIATCAQWRLKREQLLESLQDVQYGHLPKAPKKVTGYLLHQFNVSPDSSVMGEHYRLTVEPCRFSYLITLIRPVSQGPLPVIIDGDGCWRYLTDDIVLTVASQGYALAIFNRVEVAPDNGTSERNTGLYTVFTDGDFGALAAWAWGYHRVVDFLSELPLIDKGRIIVTGHSRGGKAALLAGATDERIALTSPNDSGCGGAGCYRFPDEGGERLADMIRVFPYWLSPRMNEYVGREYELPFDQHSLKALVAPRALFSTEAIGDIWASPRGTHLTYEAARVVYKFLAAEQQIGIWYRPGNHAHTKEDWLAMLDFANYRLFGKQPARDFNMNPFRHEP